MGISDEETIIKALTDSNGSVEGAMMSLMSQFEDDYGDEDDQKQ